MEIYVYFLEYMYILIYVYFFEKVETIFFYLFLLYYMKKQRML